MQPRRKRPRSNPNWGGACAVFSTAFGYLVACAELGFSDATAVVLVAAIAGVLYLLFEF